MEKGVTHVKVILICISFSWRDLGLLRSSFNLGSTQILDTYIQTGNLFQAVTDKQVRHFLMSASLVEKGK